MNDIELYHVINPFDTRSVKPVVVTDCRNLRQLLVRHGIDPFAVEVSVNGILTRDVEKLIWPGDMIHVYYRPQGGDALKIVSLAALAVVSFYVAGPAVAGAIGGNLGFVMGGLTSIAMVTAGGLLINSMLSTPANNRSNSDEEQSPTYGFTQSGNNRDEGFAIPVIYGEVASTPQTINQYIAIDANGDQWSYTLLSVHEGPTNNNPDVQINREDISALETADYSVSISDGSASPSTSVFSDFTRLHQMRWFDKFLDAAPDETYISVLLNLNGTDGSTTILDEAQGAGDWTCKNLAHITTAEKWDGTGSLDLESNSGYIKLDRMAPFDIIDEDIFDIEFRFRQDSLTDSAMCGQKLQREAGGTYYQWYWSLCYISGSLVFQSWYRTGAVGSWTESTYCNYSVAVSLSPSTWYHIRLARSTTAIYFWLDGTRQTAGTYSTPSTPLFIDDSWQYVGRAHYWTGSGDPDSEYGNCLIDAFRLSIGEHLYDFDGDIVPNSSESGIPNTQYFVLHGAADRVSVFLECRNGLYKMQDDGTLDSLTLTFLISYREVDGGEWVSSEETMTGQTQYPVRKQFDYNFPTRGNYEIKVSRVTPKRESTAKVDDVYWFALDEVLDETLYYPYLQCIAVKLKAQNTYNTRVPEYRAISNVSSITVPTFDGTITQTVDPTNNAYAALDALTNSVYGAGLNAEDSIDEDTWQDWVDWCDTSIDGYSRCQFNMIFDSSYTMDKAIQHIESCGRARLINRGTKLSVIIEKPGSRSYPYSDGNIKTGSSTVNFLPVTERSDAVEIMFKDKDLNWTNNKAFAPGAGYESLTTVPRVTRLTIPGINNYEQALREAIFRQQISENIKRSIQFESGIESIRSLSGDIIEFQSGGNSLTAGGRISHDADYKNTYTGTTVYLDNDIELAESTFSGNCVLVIRESDDTITEVNITGPWDTETNIFTVDTSTTFTRFSPYLIRRSTSEVYLYRITGIRRSSDQDVAVTAIQYVSDSYYNAGYGGGTTPI